jgi:hypothetical protein
LLPGAPRKPHQPKNRANPKVSRLLIVSVFIYTLITFALMLYHNTHEHDEADRRVRSGFPF